MASRFAKFAFPILMVLLCAGQCVKSNLDNAFDPASIPGMIIGLAISSGSGGGSSSSSLNPSASVCSDVTPTIVEFATVGTTTYTVPATVKYVTIRAIGGGGAGGYGLGSTGVFGHCAIALPNPPFSTYAPASSSSVKIQGAGVNLLEALPGAHGGCGDDVSYQGIGGAGGAPGGVGGVNGNLTLGNTAAGGSLGTLDGAGGKGGQGTSIQYGGGGGGSGANVVDTFSDLAGEILEISVGIGGDGFNPGTKGHVQLILF